jgi:hypothetical protein
VRGLSGFSKSYAEGVLTFKDGEFLEDRRDVLPDLRAKKMAGISRSFFIPKRYPNYLTDRHVPQTDKDWVVHIRGQES